MMRRVFALGALLLLAACGGGGGGGGYSSGYSTGGASSSAASSSSSSSSVFANSVPMRVELWPDAATGNVNIGYMTLKICAPGTTTCQTIDHIIVDTGSEGLRIENEALSAAMRAALPETASGTGHLAECYQYVDGYVWGSVRTADLSVGDEQVSGAPLMIIGETGDYAAVPSDCTSGGGNSHDTIADFGGNGIIGIGVLPDDCGNYCQVTTNNGYYYMCPSGGGCTPVTAPVSAQVPNPVARLSVDNNGVIIDLPAVAPLGQASLAGTLYFGIGTRANNALSAANVLTTSTDGLLTATYNGQTLNQSFIDSGTNFYGFSDSAITQCTGNLKGFYCPASSLALTATLTGKNAVSANVGFVVDNTEQLNGYDAVLPGLAGDPNGFDNLQPYSDSFDFGLPFFYGKRVYTAIYGRAAGGYTGPYVAF